MLKHNMDNEGYEVTKDLYLLSITKGIENTNSSGILKFYFICLHIENKTIAKMWHSKN